jgi:CPA1 family monovalent cation:H+ antiporter
MLESQLLLVIALLFAVSLLSMLSERLKISYPIFLVLAGLIISVLPHVPKVSLDPHYVFLIFLPPLLYAASWNTSWNEFWFFRRPIGLLAFGLVIFTSTAVAIVSHLMIPDFSLAMGFLLGGIISPPDAIAATSVIKQLKVPKRVITILEGESLVNDASSLIVFRFALVTIFTGQFVLWKAGLNFIVVAAMGIVVGLALAYIIYAVHKFLPTTPSIDAGISLIAPYMMYITAEHFGFSGVLAVVSGGLFLSYSSSDLFSYSTRLQLQSVWDTVVFLLNGMVFILIGLQMHHIIRSVDQSSLNQAVIYAVVISLVTIVVRIIWVFPGTYLPRIFSRYVRQRETRPPWQAVFVVAWSGMRGVVSLASALSVPLLLSDGTAFPNRNLILFISFVVILFTLVLQGLSLPWIISRLKLEVADNDLAHELAIQLRLSEATIRYLENNYDEELQVNAALRSLKDRYQAMIESHTLQLEKIKEGSTITYTKPIHHQVMLELVHIRRLQLKHLRHEKKYPDEVLRKKEMELDLEEARLRQ